MGDCVDYIEITGGVPLSGEVSISGAKNAAVAIIPAAICAHGVTVLENLPNIEDVHILTETLQAMNIECEKLDDYTLRIDSSKLETHMATFDALKRMRASYYLIGALLSRFGCAEVAMPGGCNFGDRPIDQHIKGFEALGAKVSIEHGIVKAYADELVGANIYLDIASVGATINIMLAAVTAKGHTVIENCAKEPHVVDVANFLNMCGANIKGAGTDVIKITGTTQMHGANYTIIPDQIEAGTYMIAAAITGGDVTVSNIIPKHMDSLSAKLREMNCTVTDGDDFIRVSTMGQKLNAVNVKTMVYPGFPTDLQPQMASLLSVCEGTSIITETVFENRFQYINELRRLGTKITVDGRVAVVEGVKRLSGTEAFATDLRAGAALIVAGLAAEGTTRIGNVKFIDRGYEKVEDKLTKLGAIIRRVDI